MHKKISKPVYLDYAATTPVDAKVLKAMQPFFSVEFGNPSSLYKTGRGAKEALEQARKNIAQIINARPEEIIFTAGGSESVNLAILGVSRINTDKKTDKHRKRPTHFISSSIEHHCVLNSLESLKQQNSKVTLVDVDTDGLVNINNLQKSIKPETVLISIMMANNEVGTIEPIAEIGKWLKRINTEREKHGLTRILFHTDACQAAGYLDLNVQELGVDMLSLNGSKIYGPKQTGILYVKSGTSLTPLIYGGGQERSLRGGTENVAGAGGLAKALELVQKNKHRENIRLTELRDYLITGIKKEVYNVLLNGVDSSKLKSNNLSLRVQPKQSHHLILDNRLPNNINFSFPGVEGEALMLYLDAEGFEVSTASACSTANPSEPSHVLMALGRSKQDAMSSIRFTIGKHTKKSDLEKLLKILPNLVNSLRKVKK